MHPPGGIRAVADRDAGNSCRRPARRAGAAAPARRGFRVPAISDAPDAAAAGGGDDDVMRHPWIDGPLFHDRRAAGLVLARELRRRRMDDGVVVGLARGGVAVAAAVADVLRLPLRAVAVTKVRHPFGREHGIGAVGPEGGLYLRAPDGLTQDQVLRAVAAARAGAIELERRLHDEQEPFPALGGETCILVDDGLATGASMVAAIRWARAAGAERVAAAVPVAAKESLPLVEDEADEVVCPYPVDPLFAVAVWYASFDELRDEELRRLLARAAPAARQ
jgi:putative phosphoribosyl transferase